MKKKRKSETWGLAPVETAIPAMKHFYGVALFIKIKKKNDYGSNNTVIDREIER